MLETKESESYIREMSKSNQEPRWMLDKRVSALSFFKEAQMPNFIYGLNINLNVSLNLDEVDITRAGSPEREVVNSSKDVVVKDFKTMLKENEQLLKDKFMTRCVKATDKFTYFHQAFVNNALLVYVPKNVKMEEPLELTTRVKSKVLFDHLIVVAEDNSEITLVENNESKDDGESYVSKVVEIFAGDNSKVDYGNLQLFSKKTFNFTKKRAVAGKDSLVNWLDCCFGSKVTLSEVTTYMDGEGANTNNYGIFFGSEEQQFDLVANSIHRAQNTVSDIFTKGALSDKAKCIYRGLVKIHRNAGSSNGYQKEDTLLLSPDAAADSIPDLEIDNSDVRCTHGATIGRIDREKLFYMQSRGLSEKEATNEYVKGFFEPLIQKMHIKKLRDNMHHYVEQRMR